MNVKIEAMYGLKVCRPEMLAKLDFCPPPTFLEVLRGLLAEAWFLFTQSLLFAASFTAFAFAAGAFRG